MYGIDFTHLYHLNVIQVTSGFTCDPQLPQHYIFRSFFIMYGATSSILEGPHNRQQVHFHQIIADLDHTPGYFHCDLLKNIRA